jgi:flavin-binding protein dodecin
VALARGNGSLRARSVDGVVAEAPRLPPSAHGVLLATTGPGYSSTPRRTSPMPESVYKIIELVGTSTESWEKAATAAVAKASKTLRDLRIAEVSELDLQLENGKIKAYRAKVKLSFKYED